MGRFGRLEKKVRKKNIMKRVLDRIENVRTRFGLDPKTRVDPGPQSPNNKFVEYRVKS